MRFLFYVGQRLTGIMRFKSFTINRLHSLHFIVACFFVLGVFVTYKLTYGNKNNQAYASLSLSAEGHEYLNYKPAMKRKIRSTLRDDADSILDLKGHDIVQIFDIPELVRLDLPTTIWQYRSQECVMDVYFTVASEADVQRANVAHYEIRSRDLREDQLDLSHCVKHLMKRNVSASLLDVQALYKVESQ